MGQAKAGATNIARNASAAQKAGAMGAAGLAGVAVGKGFDNLADHIDASRQGSFSDIGAMGHAVSHPVANLATGFREVGHPIKAIKSGYNHRADHVADMKALYPKDDDRKGSRFGEGEDFETGMDYQEPAPVMPGSEEAIYSSVQNAVDYAMQNHAL
jgi:hypothetical protein